MKLRKLFLFVAIFALVSLPALGSQQVRTSLAALIDDGTKLFSPAAATVSFDAPISAAANDDYELNAPVVAGDLDLDFAGGVGNAESDFVYSITSDQDGKLIIGGGFDTINGAGRNRIARLNGDGSIDNTFDSGVGLNGSVYAVSLQPDGKILVGGNFTTFTNASGTTNRGH